MKGLFILFWAGLAFASGPEVLRGTVKQTLDGGAYTYILITTPQGDQWAAVNKTTLKDGATVGVIQDTVMQNFESPTLKRSFDRVVFGALEGGKKGGNPHAGLKIAAPTGPVKPVAKASGPDGRTIAELFSQKAALNGKTVAVRGRVVKYNGQIMGSNWIHLRDGSGTEGGKDNDITVTTQQTAAVGDVVTARGSVSLDKDVGAGYFYPVIIEKAALIKP
jgi:hypothetical protein